MSWVESKSKKSYLLSSRRHLENSNNSSICVFVDIFEKFKLKKVIENYDMFHFYGLTTSILFVFVGLLTAVSFFNVNQTKNNLHKNERFINFLQILLKYIFRKNQQKRRFDFICVFQDGGRKEADLVLNFRI